jgi:hypothetical protein
MKIQSKKNTSLKDSLIRRYHSALEEFPLYALLIAAFYIYYRLRIWMMIGDTYASLGGLGYGSYLGIYGYSDAAILLLSLAIILAFIMATESGSLLRHIPVSVFIFIQAAGLLFGIEFFRVYERPCRIPSGPLRRLPA